ncbi:unnamed protein product [Urochloa decumbens]|uniref:DUF4378 domain-containing protein n=1 Tax=Urochloa decumbens TaxID=240449 RepID=A0ABC8Y366_9POAL
MLQYWDFSHACTSKKWGHKRQGDGFEAPRNSMEFAMEASHSYGVFQDDAMYSCNMRQYPKSGLSHSSAPIKKLIHEDMSFRTNEGHKRPCVIARLMGMDSPPLNTTTESISRSEERRSEITPRSVPRSRDPSEMISTNKHVSCVPLPLNKDSIKHAPRQEIRAYDDVRGLLGQLSKSNNNEWSKLQPREHPQEEELQKFKKEFEAWQASRAWEQSTSFELESNLLLDDDDKCADIVPYRLQHQHHKGKDANNGNKYIHSNDDVHRRRSKESSTSISGSRTFSLTSAADACSTRLPLSRFYHEEERSASPTRIVVLKPCPELSMDDIEESSLGSPELLKKENNMEAFLEEVKKRLKIELEGSMASDDKSGRWAAGADIPADPKQIARSIANQIRENVVTRELHPALVRSESTRSYRSDVPFNGQSQMDYIGRDARRQLSDRLKNVLRREPDAEPPFSHRRRATSTSFDEEPEPEQRPKPRQEMARRKGKIRSKEEKKCAIESDARSLRYGSSSNKTPTTTQLESEPVSPRNLMRSFSAPVSGTTFVKLLSEEPRVLTGARLQRKQEGHHGSSKPSSSSEERKGRKDAFGIKGKVHNLRQNLGLRAKLFGKKFQASDESFPDDLPPIGMLVTAPSVLIHPGVLQENSTEVPPSPASWCSSPPDEMSRGGYPSPVSPLEAAFSEHRSPLRAAAKDMSSNACEPGTLSAQVQTTEEEHAETSPVLDDQDDDMDELDRPIKSFIRAVLVVAGMYGPRKNPGNLISDCEAKPIPKRVLEEVESSSSTLSASSDGGAAAGDHRLLFDLINEALPGAIRASTTLTTFDKSYVEATRRAPSGKKLLEALWRSVQVWLEPPSDNTTSSSASVDVLIGRDLSMSAWHGAFCDDADELGGDVEEDILDELVDEMVWDVLLNVGD